ncbi:unnamed protein product (macronuclear) [Paramecium tetraurelia]|uniref:Uncharacterized protein n=1 Tax=Paramecium tetraurelia TaxID=5888 RepID=A0DPU6_PARTE|nr:uncharacterized protein GSPATT00039714001 [Paramecium tetraurelia]CAK85063.1 unnamed protein product [Paramecium tetraurelia]|eukprot:XP_001452460.1 hypothetical protein (macronuclear) [Paramecium tetraurelia strain d4-2]
MNQVDQEIKRLKSSVNLDNLVILTNKVDLWQKNIIIPQVQYQTLSDFLSFNDKFQLKDFEFIQKNLECSQKENSV